MKKSKKLFLFIVFLAVSVCLFGVKTPITKAATAEELLAQIAALQSQITSLQQQLAQIQGGGVWCYDFNEDLKYGTAGEKVRALQIALEKEGFYKSEVNQPSHFDERMASAVSGFQEKYIDEILTPL